MPDTETLQADMLERRSAQRAAYLDHAQREKLDRALAHLDGLPAYDLSETDAALARLQADIDMLDVTDAMEADGFAVEAVDVPKQENA